MPYLQLIVLYGPFVSESGTSLLVSSIRDAAGKWDGSAACSGQRESHERPRVHPLDEGLEDERMRQQPKPQASSIPLLPR